MYNNPLDLESPTRDFALYAGVVENREDPKKQGRVRVTIPGILEPGRWAQVCMPGSPFNNGMFVVPAVGGQVIVGFLNGDYDQPIVLGGTTPPTVADGLRANTSVEDLPKIMTIENEDTVVVLGKRATNVPYFSVYTRDAEPLMSVVLDLDQKMISVKAPTAFTVQSDGLVSTNAPLQQFGNRLVQQNGKVI